MKKCPHCSSQVQQLTATKFFCTYCEIMVSEEPEIKPYVLRGAVDHVDAAKPTSELKFYHTFDLLLLLGFCRQERRYSYELMLTIGKVRHVNLKFTEGHKEAYKQYKNWTMKKDVLESLVKERIGTVPKAITQNLLHTFLHTFEIVESAV